MFKVGDKVRRFRYEHLGMKVGDIGTVEAVNMYSIALDEYKDDFGGGWHDSINFELVLEEEKQEENNELQYFIRVVEGCISSVKTFNTKEELNEFITTFVETHGTLDDEGDNWIELDSVFYGKQLAIKTTFSVE